MTFVLGINAYHGDASACLRKDGALIAAAEEERFRRIKHWAGFPSEAIRFCLRSCLEIIGSGQPSQHNPGHSDVNPGFIGSSESLVALAQAA